MSLIYPLSNALYQKSVSYAGALAVTNGLLTSFATAASPVVKTVFGGSVGGGAYPLPRTITITSSAHTGSYNLTNILITGTDFAGNVQTENVHLLSVDGGEIIVSTKGFLSVTQINFPAMVDTLGAFTVGVQDVLVPMGSSALRCGTTGNIKVAYTVDGSTDVIPAVAISNDYRGNVSKVFGSSSTTAQNISILF